MKLVSLEVGRDHKQEWTDIARPQREALLYRFAYIYAPIEAASHYVNLENQDLVSGVQDRHPFHTHDAKLPIFQSPHNVQIPILKA